MKGVWQLSNGSLRSVPAHSRKFPLLTSCVNGKPLSVWLESPRNCGNTPRDEAPSGRHRDIGAPIAVMVEISFVANRLAFEMPKALRGFASRAFLSRACGGARFRKPANVLAQRLRITALSAALTCSNFALIAYSFGLIPVPYAAVYMSVSLKETMFLRLKRVEFAVTVPLGWKWRVRCRAQKQKGVLK